MLTLVILCASWGLQQVAIKIASEGISPVLQSGLRSVGATILVGVWMLLRKNPIFERDGTLWWGLAAGFLFAAEFLLIYLGLEYTNASRSVIFLYLSPFVVALGAQLFIPGENLRFIQVLGLICAFTGIVVAFSESMRLPTYTMLIGDAMIVLAAIFWGATTVLIKAGPLASISPAKTLLYQLAISAVALMGSFFLWNEPGITKVTPLIIGSLVYQTIWIATITYLAWFWLITHYPAYKLASFTFLTPLFGVLAGGIILNEPITISLLIALALVGTGICLVNKRA
ncbi:MAG: DMT family transporter [Syntrophaceae bacterium]|nr:DMT family transporter [Syntrophaceae bacterium]